MIGPGLGVAPPFDGPDERRRREHAVERVDVRAESQQHAHGLRMARHRGAMKRGDVVLVLRVRIEPAREHRLEHRGVPAFGRTMQHEVVLGTQLRAQARMAAQHRLRGRAIAARAGGDEPLDRRELVFGAVGEQPRRDVVIAVQLRQRVRRAAVGAAAQRIGAVLHEQFDHRHIPSPRRDVQRRFAVMAPREIRIRAVFEQPARSGRIGGPVHHVDQRRHAAGNPVHVDAEAVQQLERGEIAAAAGDVDGHAVGRIGAGLEQHLRERQMPDCTDRAPQRRARKLRMPVPVIFGVRIRAECAQPPRDRDQSVDAAGIARDACTCGTRTAAAPSSAVRPAAVASSG